MNAIAKRIDNLFVKSGIVFLRLPVIAARGPPEAARGNAQSPALLLLIKAVNQECD